MSWLRRTDRSPARGHEDGSVTVMAAALLFLAGIMSVLTLDITQALQARARAQTAADAAALAAMQELVLPSGRSAEEVAAEYARRNGATLLMCRCHLGATEAVARVEVPVATVFLGGGRTAQAVARAVVEGPSSASVGTIGRDAKSRTH